MKMTVKVCAFMEPVGWRVVVKAIVIGVEGRRFNSWVDQIGNSMATFATFLQSYVVQALSRRDGSRCSLITRIGVIPRV